MSFVDNSIEAINSVRKNLSTLNEIQNVYNMDAFEYLKTDDGLFDLVFIDPPYHFEKIDELFSQLKTSGKLAKNAIIVYEAGSDENITDFAYGFKLVKEKKYGITKLFYLMEETEK